MRLWSLAIWRTPTWFHLLALSDFLNIVRIAIEAENPSGIDNLCDNQPLFVQDFLDQLAGHRNYSKPWQIATWIIYAAAGLCESFATVFHTATPLTRDIVRMGMTLVAANPNRMTNDLVRDVMYPTLAHGLAILGKPGLAPKLCRSVGASHPTRIRVHGVE